MLFFVHPLSLSLSFGSLLCFLFASSSTAEGCTSLQNEVHFLNQTILKQQNALIYSVLQLIEIKKGKRNWVWSRIVEILIVFMFRQEKGTEVKRAARIWRNDEWVKKHWFLLDSSSTISQMVDFEQCAAEFTYVCVVESVQYGICAKASSSRSTL